MYPGHSWAVLRPECREGLQAALSLVAGRRSADRSHAVPSCRFPYTEGYAAAKDGLIAFTRVLRADCRTRGISGSTLILDPVGEAGAGARTAQEGGPGKRCAR